MKNLSLFILLITFCLFSCSEDSQDYQQSEQSVDSREGFQTKSLTPNQVTALQNQMRTISTSSAWNQKEAAADAFFINANGTTPDVRSRSAFGTWISSNIHLTLWPSTAAATAAFDNFNAKIAILRVQNQSFFADIADATAPQLEIIFQPIRIPTPVAPQPLNCWETCAEKADSCYDAAAIAWHATVAAGEAMGEGQAAQAVADVAIRLANATCKFRMNRCYSRC